MEELPSRGRRKLIERVTGSVSQGSAKSQYLLKLCSGVQPELIGAGRRRSWTPRGLGSGGKTLVAGGDPDRNLRADIRRFVFGRAHSGRGPDQLPGSNGRGQSQS